MARIFDMSSGRIQPDKSGDTLIIDYHDIPETGPALQEVSELPQTVTRADACQQHIRELLKKF